MNLFTEITKAGIPYSSHESDLYVKDTPEARSILEKFPLEKGNATRFKNQINGELWIDIPFAYTPYWQRRESKLSTEPNKPRTLLGSCRSSWDDDARRCHELFRSICRHCGQPVPRRMTHDGICPDCMKMHNEFRNER